MSDVPQPDVPDDDGEEQGAPPVPQPEPAPDPAS